MAGTSGKQISPIINLLRNPESFNFYQAVRLLKYAKNYDIPLNAAEFPPSSNVSFLKISHLNFQVSSACSLPSSAIVMLGTVEDPNNQEMSIVNLKVSFFGLTGINGALPHHYTEKLLFNTHQGNFVLKDFFNIFNNKAIELFYKAWKKNHYYVGYKPSRHLLSSDPFSFALESLAGADSKSLISNLKIAKETFAYYASLFCGQVSSAVALEAMLNEYFELPIAINQFQGEWLYLNDRDLSVIGNRNSIFGRYHQLGQDMVLGKRQWVIQNNFRVYIGPVDYTQFRLIHPKSELIFNLVQMIRLYVKAELTFDIQIELKSSEIPICRLNVKESMILGWNTWIRNKPLLKNSKAVVIHINK